MIIKDMCVFALGDSKENAVKVQQGEILEFYTRDCFNNQIDSEDYVMDVLDWDHINPATGPVYVEGAEKGDVLKVEILDIVLEDSVVLFEPFVDFTRSSTIVFHAPQSGQRPTHLGELPPHSEQNHIVFSFAIIT